MYVTRAVRSLVSVSSRGGFQERALSWSFLLPLLCSDWSLCIKTLLPHVQQTTGFVCRVLRCSEFWLAEQLPRSLCSLLLLLLRRAKLACHHLFAVSIFALLLTLLSFSLSAHPALFCCPFLPDIWLCSAAPPPGFFCMTHLHQNLHELS